MTASLADVSRCSTDSSRSSPVIKVANSRAVTPAAARVTTRSPLRSTVIRSPTSSTSLSLWEMNTTVRPVATSVAHHAEQLARLGGGEHGGGLVEDQCSRPPSQHPQDLDPLLLADRELPDLRLRIDPQPELVHQAVGARHQLAAGDARRGRVPSEVDVLRHGHRRDEPEVLVHHPDAGGDGLGGGVELVRRSVDLDVAGVGAVDAGEDVAQRRLAGAVLPEQRVDLAAAQLEVDVAKRPDPVEALRDVAGPDGRDVGRDVDRVDRPPRRRGQPSTPDTPSTAQSMR